LPSDERRRSARRAIDTGRITEEGPHEVLMARDGLALEAA
jgi:ABC-type multidrug transport system fused ATPase/permease subunit